MAKFTNPSLTELLVCEQTDDSGLQLSPTFLELRGKSEAATNNATREKSGEFSDTNAVTDKVKLATDPKQPFTMNLTGDDAEKIVMEASLSSDFDADGIIKGGTVNKWLTLRRVLINDKGSYVTDTINCIVNMALSIVGKQLDTVAVDANGTTQIKRDLQLGYQDTIAPDKIFGGDESTWLKSDTGFLYLRSLRTWSSTAMNASNAFTSSEQWSAITVDPVATTLTAQWLINTVLGGVWLDNGTDAPTLIFTWIPDGSSWFNGTTVPASSTGSRNSLYIRTGDGSETYHADIYQKIFNGIDDVWTKVMNWNTGSIGTTWYQNTTVTAKSTNAIMVFPKLRNFAIMNVIGNKCVNDLSLNIDNTSTPEHGICTDNVNASTPNYGAIGVARGERAISGKFASYFYDDEISKIEAADSELYFEFMVSNGTQAYRIQIPKAKLEGDEQAGSATDSSVKADYSYDAIVENTNYDSEIVITHIDDIADYPPLMFGWVVDPAAINTTTDHLETTTNYNGNFKVPTKPALGSWYFVICTPATEPSIDSLINTTSGLDEITDYAENVATQELVAGVDYNVNESADTSVVPTAAEIFIINR